MMHADAIDLSKENIQPLRHGRKVHMLGLALQAETDCEVQQQLMKERDEYELLIRVYDGPDPLKPRSDYVYWLEQSYPKHGRDSNLIPLLEDTISIFKDDEKYLQDVRFIELIVKFINTQVNPLELYQVVYNLGIGTKCALFYKSWAEEFDGSGDFKRANQILQLGISNLAEPLEALQQDQKLFQLSVCRRMLNGEELTMKEEPVETSRQVLGKLRSKVGSSRPTLGKAGVVPLCLSNTNVQKLNAPIAIYEDGENEFTTPGGAQATKTPHLPKSDFAKKENCLKPGSWAKAYKPPKHQHHQVFTPTTPNFQVHEDPEDASSTTPMSFCPSALKPRKADTFHCPMAIFEPADPSLKPMYCKSKIYAGGREFQFEEVMAAMYYKKRREELLKEEMVKLGMADLSISCFQTPQSVRKPPSTPLDISSVHLISHYDNEVVMEGAETTRKNKDDRVNAQRPPEKDTKNKPTESTSNIKKCLQFTVYCDVDDA